MLCGMQHQGVKPRAGHGVHSPCCSLRSAARVLNPPVASGLRPLRARAGILLARGVLRLPRVAAGRASPAGVVRASVVRALRGTHAMVEVPMRPLRAYRLRTHWPPMRPPRVCGLGTTARCCRTAQLHRLHQQCTSHAARMAPSAPAPRPCTHEPMRACAARAALAAAPMNVGAADPKP